MHDPWELTEEQQQKLNAWLQEKWNGAKLCPICNQDTLALESALAEVGVFVAGGGIYAGSPSYPCAVLICTNCGYTLLFNAVLSGIVPGTDKEGKDGPK
jgi:hypothetical protein